MKINKGEKMKTLNIKKDYGRESYDITLLPMQKVRFITSEGYIVIEVEVRDGELYLMKQPSVKGHTAYGKTFGEEQK